LDNKLRLLANALLVATIVLIFVVTEIKNKLVWVNDSLGRGRFVLMSYAVTLGLLLLLFYIWFGNFGIHRISDYGTVGSVLVLPILIVRLKSHKAKQLLSVLVALTIASSVLAYTLDENHGVAVVTVPEAAGMIWLGQSTQSTHTVFTDFRLSGTLVWLGFLRTTGVDERVYSAPFTLELLDAVYYGHNSSDVMNVQLTSEAAGSSAIDYVVLSQQMTKNVPGIRGYSYAFAPAPPGFMDNFDRNSGMNLVLSNLELRIYYIPP
jgi:hypothetical protein